MLVLNSLYTSRDRNILTEGKKKMTGNLSVSSSRRLNFPKIKALSKDLGGTINDVVMSSLSVSLKQYFKKHGDPLGNDDVKAQL